MSRRKQLKAPTRAELERQPFIPIDPAEHGVRLRNAVNDTVLAWRWGACSVILTREYGDWHFSIAHPDRLPTWDEVVVARYRLVPDHVTMAMILPPRHAYVDIHRFCLQVVSIDRPDVPRGYGPPRPAGGDPPTLPGAQENGPTGQ